LFKLRETPRVFPVAFSLFACSAGEKAQAQPNDAGLQLTRSVELGVPTGDDGLDFAPLADGDELRLKTFGQGGTHVMLGVRTIGFGGRAFVGFTLLNQASGNEIVAPPPVRPQLFFCTDEDPDVCELVPVTVMTGGLTDPEEERDGLEVRILVTAETTTGVSGSDEAEVVLSTADLD
jgi:hypothetical protein